MKADMLVKNTHHHYCCFTLMTTYSFISMCPFSLLRLSLERCTTVDCFNGAKYKGMNQILIYTTIRLVESILLISVQMLEKNTNEQV